MNKISNQRGSAALIVLGALVALLLGVALIGVVSYISASNKANGYENQLVAAKENSENSLAQYGQKVLEAAQVTELYRDDVTTVVKAAVGGRYGENGSQAVFQMLTEQNPTLDASVYTKIQQLVEGGRTQFQNEQTRMIDIKRAYSTALGTVWGGFWMGVAGYPKINLEDFKPVSTDRAQEAFKNGKESGPIQLRATPQVQPTE